MLAIGVPALRIISLCFVFAGFSIICSSTFQALGNGLLSMMISIVRQLLILLPAAFFLSLSGSVTAVWWAFPYRGAGFSGPLCDLPAAYLPQGDPPSGVSAPPSPCIQAAPYLSGVPFPAGYSAALGRRVGCPHPPGAGRWPGGAGRRGRRPLQRSAAAGTRPAKMLRRGGGLSPLAGGHKGRPYFRGLVSGGLFAALGRRGGCPHPPGAGRWPGGAGRCGHRPLQRSAAAGTARPKCP